MYVLKKWIYYIHRKKNWIILSHVCAILWYIHYIFFIALKIKKKNCKLNSFWHFYGVSFWSLPWARARVLLDMVNPAPEPFLYTAASTKSCGFSRFFFLFHAVGHRIWAEFVDYNLDESQSVKVYLSGDEEYVTPFRYRNSINDGAFLSEGESVKIEYSTNRLPRGRGFKIDYKTGVYSLYVWKTAVRR